MNKKVLVSVITFMSDWKQQITDIKRNNIKEFALFLTGLDRSERAECYKMLEAIPQITIPFIHATSGMTVEEYRYLLDYFDVEYFNLHPPSNIPIDGSAKEFKAKILLENTGSTANGNLPAPAELDEFAGFCLDISHLENHRLNAPEKFAATVELIKKYPPKANHLSPILKNKRIKSGGALTNGTHTLSDESGIDYIKNYPAEYFSPLIAIEFANNISTQLQAKQYIEDILGL